MTKQSSGWGDASGNRGSDDLTLFSDDGTPDKRTWTLSRYFEVRRVKYPKFTVVMKGR